MRMTEDTRKEAIKALKKEWFQLKKDDLIELLVDSVRRISKLEAQLNFFGSELRYFADNKDVLARIIRRDFKMVTGWLHSMTFDWLEVTLAVVDKKTDYTTKAVTTEFKEVKLPKNAVVQFEIIKRTEIEAPKPKA